MFPRAAANRWALCLCLASLVLAFAGCAPQRAQTPPPPTAVPATAAPPPPAPAPTSVPTPALNTSPLPTPGSGNSPLPTPGAGALNETPGQALLSVVAAPEKYAGQVLTVAGTLEAEGSMPDVRFFLRSDDGQSLAVEPWVPLEVMQPPKDGTAPRTMAAFAGRRLQLTGTLEKRNNAWFLIVSKADEF